MRHPPLWEAGQKFFSIATLQMGQTLLYYTGIRDAPVVQLDRASDSGSECWGFESLRAYQVHVVKMLSCPSSQCFQRIRGPRKVKSEGREILLSASCFPKQEGLALTRPPSCIALPQTCPAKDKEILCAFDAAPMAQAGPKGAAFFCPLNCCQRIPNSGKLAIC